MYIREYQKRSDRVNEILAKGLIDHFRSEKEYHTTPAEKHLEDCPDATVHLEKANDGFYGCETGCEYYDLVGSISCEHGYITRHDASSFGELDWVFNL